MIKTKMSKKKIFTGMITGVLVLGMALAPAAETKATAKASYSKNENVYVRMKQDGDLQGAYVVNTFTVEDEGEITDSGEYASILNLTNLDEIEEDGDEYTFYAEEGKFYYQGNMEDADLPWNFEIRYELDGKDIEPEELAGAEGDLEIHIGIKENIAAENPAFYQSYLLQVSLTLDNDLCEDITAKGASMADAGSDQKITFTVMPDNKKAAELLVSATVKDFEMDDISINGAAMTDFPVSFVSDENKNMGQAMFIMSAEGIAIPEEEEAEPVVEEDNRNFFQKLFDKIFHHEED